jgi:cytochrome P450
LTIEEFIDNFDLFIFAGNDTTSHSMAGLYYRLHKHPEHLAKIKQEIVDKFGGNYEAMIQKMDLETLGDMPYLNACVKEGLRVDSAAASTLTYDALQDV